MGAQRNDILRVLHEMQRRDTIPVTTSGSKTSSSFEKGGNIGIQEYPYFVLTLQKLKSEIVRLFFESVCLSSM